MLRKKLRRILEDMDLRKNRGIAIITVSALLFVFLGFGSLVFDIGYLHIVKGELQNAADAGALAATAVLYDNFGENINPGANAVGEAAAKANNSQNLAVEVFDALSNNGDVQRGHWSFTTRTFTPNPSLTVVPLWDVPTSELDTNTDFINAVRVRTRRENIPAYSILSKIYGHDSFQMHAEAVAYIGFTGSLLPGEIDQPIAICLQSIMNWDEGAGEYTCTAGRMINSGGNAATNNTAGWTNFTQDPCDTASVPTVRPLICANLNPELSVGQGMGTVGGMQDNVYRDLRDCWLGAGLDTTGNGIPDQPWPLKLPVVDCPSNNISPCSVLMGAVDVNVLWIKDSGTDPQWLDVPLEMHGTSDGVIPDWTCSHKTAPEIEVADLTEAQRQACFYEFGAAFDLLRADDVPLDGLTPSDVQKTMFFRPDCSPHELAGRTGGINTGVLAKIPVLVQ
jgi:hypothetical protein